MTLEAKPVLVKSEIKFEPCQWEECFDVVEGTKVEKVVKEEYLGCLKDEQQEEVVTEVVQKTEDEDSCDVRKSGNRERLFVCSICGKRFGYKNVLKIHMIGK